MKGKEISPAARSMGGDLAYKAKYEAARYVLADRETELLGLKGPCSVAGCRLHYAHSGPCDIKPSPNDQIGGG